jgi:hypothetical protein
MLQGELITTAQRRQSDPPKLIHLVKGDLDWMVMRALEKDRTRRYETASGFAMDVERYLADEPVLARPPSSLYRIQKLVQRNKLAFIATTAVVCSLIIGLAVAIWLLAREKQARRLAAMAAVAAASIPAAISAAATCKPGFRCKPICSAAARSISQIRNPPPTSSVSTAPNYCPKA